MEVLQTSADGHVVSPDQTKANVMEAAPDKNHQSSDVLDGVSSSRPEGLQEEEGPVIAGNLVLSTRNPFVPREDGFDMQIVSRNFEKCLEGTDEVNMGLYIVAYRELERFFELMGSVFGFVGADIKEKLEILHKHHQSPTERSYETVKGMMEYETALPERLEPTRTTNSHELPSGSRTLLRLHRALKFIMIFMEGLIRAEDGDPVSHIAQEAYRDSLARYHGWLIRNGAKVAMYVLPTKLVLMERISKHSYLEVTGIAQGMVSSMRPVYDRTENLYSEFKLHDLP